MSTGDEIREIVNGVSDPKLFVYNCLLLKDGIGTKEEIAQFLEFAGGTGVPKVGFVTPMPVNDYVKNNKVSYTDIFDRSDDRFLFTTCYKDYEFCHCCDGVYVTKNGKLVEFYGRETIRDAKDYSRGLVYGPDNILRMGFSEDAGVVAVM